MTRTGIKRETDLQLISDWIEPGNRVLDIGCGRGILLEHLHQTKATYGIGVDTDLSKIQSCIKRGVNAYQGEAESLLAQFPDRFFDWVVLSRTAQELGNPVEVITEALRVGKHLAIGFANYGYWKNRAALLKTGNVSTSNVFPDSWKSGTPYHPISVNSFEAFCQKAGFTIERAIYLGGDWKSPCQTFPNLRAGYALYALAQ